MATAAKKASTTRSKAKAAKKGVAKKSSPSRKNTAATKQKKPPAKSPAPPGRGQRPRDQMYTGALVVIDGVLGVDIATGFIPLEHFAEQGEHVEFAFTLTPHRSSDPTAALQRLLEFIQNHADDSVMGVVRCCVT